MLFPPGLIVWDPIKDANPYSFTIPLVLLRLSLLYHIFSCLFPTDSTIQMATLDVVGSYLFSGSEGFILSTFGALSWTLHIYLSHFLNGNRRYGQSQKATLGFE